MKLYKMIAMLAVLMGMLWITVPSVYADSAFTSFIDFTFLGNGAGSS